MFIHLSEARPGNYANRSSWACSYTILTAYIFDSASNDHLDLTVAAFWHTLDIVNTLTPQYITQSCIAPLLLPVSLPCCLSRGMAMTSTLTRTTTNVVSATTTPLRPFLGPCRPMDPTCHENVRMASTPSTSTAHLSYHPETLCPMCKCLTADPRSGCDSEV